MVSGRNILILDFFLHNRVNNPGKSALYFGECEYLCMISHLPFFFLFSVYSPVFVDVLLFLDEWIFFYLDDDKNA